MPVRRSTGRVTLADVAKHAGVSPMTASRALNGSVSVAEDLRDRVMRAAELLNYVPNAGAKALASGQSNNVYLFANYADLVWAERAYYSLAEGFADNGFKLRISVLDGQPDSELDILAECLGRNPAGVLITFPPENARFNKLLERASCPVINLVETSQTQPQAPGGFSSRKGGYMAARHLIEAGYRHIGFLAPLPNWRVLARLSGFTEALKEEGILNRELIISSETQSSIANGSDLMTKLKQRGSTLDAVCCYDDQMAAGALFACQRMGVSVPEELGICGFGDYEIAAECTPSITSIAARDQNLAGEIARYLQARQNGDSTPVVFRGERNFTLIERESTMRRKTPDDARLRG